jgi:hypothetical protein
VKPSALKREHQALQNMKILDFFLFLMVIFAPWIQIRIRNVNADPDPDPATQFNADPCGSGSGSGSGSETLHKTNVDENK